MSVKRIYIGLFSLALLAAVMAGLVTSYYSVEAAGEFAATVETCTPPGASDPETSNLVSYWPLDEIAGATTFPDVVGSHDGTCTGIACPAAGLTGKAGTAADFSASDSDVIVVPTDPDFDFLKSQDFSVGLWMKTTQICTDNKVFFGRYWNNTINDTWWLGCVPDGDDSSIGYAAFRLRQQAGGGTPERARQVESTTQINDGKWHYIVGVRKGSSDENHLYVDGVLEGTLTSPLYDASDNFTWSGNLTMGAYDLGGPGYYYQGVLDEITVYGRELTSPEIKDYSDACNTPPIVGNVNFNTFMDTNLMISELELLANSSDPDGGDTLSIAAVDATSTQGGTITGALPGSFTYTPPAGYIGSDSFGFSVTDGTASTPGTANIQVHEVLMLIYLPIVLK